MVGDYFKSKADVLQYTDEAADLIAWLRSKTLLLALLRQVQATLPAGKTGVKAIIRAVLTRWTMHYQAYRRLRELRTVIATVVLDNGHLPVGERRVITGDARARAKANEMVNLVNNGRFWDSLTVYVQINVYPGPII